MGFLAIVSHACIISICCRDPSALAYAIKRSCENKAEVVSLDEKESGLRATLNLGHTFGHVSFEILLLIIFLPPRPLPLQDLFLGFHIFLYACKTTV